MFREEKMAVPSFRFCPILQIENLETLESFLLFQIFSFPLHQVWERLKPFIKFQINIPHVIMNEDTSHNKYILLRQGNILNIYFW